MRLEVTIKLETSFGIQQDRSSSEIYFLRIPIGEGSRVSIGMIVVVLRDRPKETGFEVPGAWMLEGVEVTKQPPYAARLCVC